MKFPRTIYWLMVVLLAAGLLPVVGVAAPAAAPAEVDAAVWEALNDNGSANVMVIMTEQADLSAAYGIEDRGARAWYVYDTLTAVSEPTQAPLLEYLDGRGLAYFSFFGQNAVGVVAADADAVQALAAMPGVSLIRLEKVMEVPPEPGAPPVGIQAFSQAAGEPDTVEWNILDVHADQVWALGYRGEGLVVANMDTGVRYTHEALYWRYRGWDGMSYDHNHNWWDPSEICGPHGSPPCDNDGHGTETMGVITGKDEAGVHEIGMAPAATWIACKGCEYNTCSEFALTSCADFFVAPWDEYGENPNPDLHPDVVNNSWGGDPCDPWYLGYVNAWRAVGIFPAFSAGNSGSACSTLGTPGDYQESFGSAAYHQNRVIASYSSRGPSCFGHDPHTKPNIAAPANICSSDNGGEKSYSCGHTGTSFSSPHTAGAVALVWNACPDFYQEIELTMDLLEDTSDDPPDGGNCGEPPDGEGNYTWGNGPLNVLAAVEVCAGGAEFGTLEGHVYDENGDPIEGATVYASLAPAAGGSIQALTDPNGFYTMQLVESVYDVTAEKQGYTTETAYGVEVFADQTTVQDFTLTYLGLWQLGTPTAFEYNRFDGVYNPNDGLVYFLGGRSGAGAHDKSIWTYDPATGVSVDTGIDMLENAANITIAFIEDDGTARGEALYVVGGYDVVVALNIDDVQRFYPQTGDVEIVATDPYPGRSPFGQIIGAGGVGVVDGKIYVFGGWESTNIWFGGQTYVFDPMAADGERWTDLECELNPARGYPNSAVSNGLIYAMGGHTEYPGDLVPTSVAEVFDTENPGACWQPIADMPVATAEGRGFGFDDDTANDYGKLYVVGGGDWPDQSAEVLEYDIATNTWDDTFPELNQARRNHAGAFVSDCTEDPDDPFPSMWVFGGRIEADDPPYGDPEFYPLPCGPQPEDTMHVSGIEGYFSMDYMGRPVLRMHVGVADQDDNPLSDVLVTAWMWVPDGGPFERSRYTKPSGNARFHWGSTASGTWEICVQDLVRDGYVYDPGDNFADPPCMDWDH